MKKTALKKRTILLALLLICMAVGLGGTCLAEEGAAVESLMKPSSVGKSELEPSNGFCVPPFRHAVQSSAVNSSRISCSLSPPPELSKLT